MYFQSIFPYLQTIYGFFLIVKKIFSAHFTQKIILDYQMFTIVQHGKTWENRSRNTFDNAITVMYFLTFILKDPVVSNDKPIFEKKFYSRLTFKFVQGK